MGENYATKATIETFKFLPMNMDTIQLIQYFTSNYNFHIMFFIVIYCISFVKTRFYQQFEIEFEIKCSNFGGDSYNNKI